MSTVYAATRKGLFTIENGKISRAAFLGLNAEYVYRDPNTGDLFTALNHGHFGLKLQKSTDNGETWKECGTPAYPKKPEGYSEKDEMGKEVDWTLKKIWSMASDKNGLWLGTIPGGLFRSTDRGATWELVRPLWDDPRRRRWFGGGAEGAGIHSILVDPRDAKRVLIAVSCAGVWVTTDGGQTWGPQSKGMRAEYMPPEKQFEETVQDPHIMVMCKAEPDCLWVQHHNGIFRSTDGSKSWQEIKTASPSVFGFAVAVHPNDPETAWFVPARKDEYRYPVDGKVVVSRTRDGGKTFQVLTKGLPQEHAYDLTYRHGLDVDSTGAKLAFGSTTGSLWVSDDQGDSWKAVSEHLPPIYCVRFA
jgi:photosystem II stability/assembly factor-like uncharacterized protein